MREESAAASRRRAAIARLGVLDRIGDPGLTGVVRIAGYVSGAAAAALHILDEDYQRRIASVNAPLVDHPRNDSMCRVVVDREEAIICADATTDPRFSFSSFVNGPEPVRFYASLPLLTSDGVVVGTLCAFDSVEINLNERQVEALEDLATQAITQIELTRIALDLAHVASHDPLTGAVNRLLLADRLAQAFARRRRHGGAVLVVAADVDEFKTVNDRFGHAYGDEVLAEVAERLRRHARDEDTVARIGGDEFVVVSELRGDGPSAGEIVSRLEAALNEPFVRHDTTVRIGVTIAGALAQPGDDVRRALARADTAMYARKGPRPRT